ncbi:MAG: ATP-binding protein, partial [Bacteroidota bacterium]
LDYLSIDDRGYSAEINPIQHRIAYQRVAKQRGLDLPQFYFSVSAADFPDSKVPYGIYSKHIVEEDIKRVRTLSEEAVKVKKPFYEFEHAIIDAKGIRKLLTVKGKSFLDSKGEVVRVLGTSEDITELRKLKANLRYKVDELTKAYQELKKAKDLFQEAESLMSYGSFDWDIEKDEIQWSDGLKKLFAGENLSNLPDKINYDFYISRTHDDDVKMIQQIVDDAINTKKSYSFQHRLIDMDGVEKTVNTKGWVVEDEENKVVRFIGNTVDITEMKIYEKELEYKVEELNRSNQELEQFAYIASHDLQEPLRKITAFGDRLSTKFTEQLGSDGLFYISRMIDAANRMKILMENLLSYSRASRKLEPVASVDLEIVLENVLSDLEMKVQETDAQIFLGEMPVIQALPSQMHQLFQNLISNSLKFVKPNGKPKISIESNLATKDELNKLGIPLKAKKYYKITVSDEGIGFDAEYAEKIFIIFQRLHGRSEFEGTGLGLAICKKIIDNHQGQIVAQSTLNEGAKFMVFLPDGK